MPAAGSWKRRCSGLTCGRMCRWARIRSRHMAEDARGGVTRAGAISSTDNIAYSTPGLLRLVQVQYDTRASRVSPGEGNRH